MDQIFLRVGDDEDLVKICGEKVAEALIPFPHKKMIIGETADKKEVFLIGVAGMSPGVGEVWITLKDKKKIAIPQAVRDGIEYCMSRWGYYRLQATAPEKDKRSVRFIEHLGFEKEGSLRQGAPDRSDMLIYAKVREDD
jgi:hypothetical protein